MFDKETMARGRWLHMVAQGGAKTHGGEWHGADWDDLPVEQRNLLAYVASVVHSDVRSRTLNEHHQLTHVAVRAEEEAKHKVQATIGALNELQNELAQREAALAAREQAT